jgi:homoserine O-succinyltransferase/O-acetyltransferase
MKREIATWPAADAAKRATAGFPSAAEARSGTLVIGFVNNMPDAALSTTERQFCGLLSASDALAVRVRRFFLPECPRSATAREYLAGNYEDIRELWTSHLDGLIVTGAEPHAAALPDEPCWSSLALLVEWAEEHTISAVWSCLAAHVAVLHRDGITRRRLPQKLSGLFECAKAAEHALLAATPGRWRIPHSRYNDLPVDALASTGYRILTRSAETGADIFIKQGRTLSVFFQGHPEYHSDTLLREYRRDVGRFLSGERNDYPAMPSGYFNEDAVNAFSAFQERALRNRDIELLASFPMDEAALKLAHPWRGPSERIYANWLSYLKAGAASSKVGEKTAGQADAG